MRAVPSAEPRFCAVNWSPPTSLRSSSPTLDWTTLPSCEASSPVPTPTRAMAPANCASSMTGSMVASSHTTATARVTRASRTIRRGPTARPSEEASMEAASMVIDTGSSRSPVSNASKPCTTCR